MYYQEYHLCVHNLFDRDGWEFPPQGCVSTSRVHAPDRLRESCDGGYRPGDRNARWLWHTRVTPKRATHRRGKTAPFSAEQTTYEAKSIAMHHRGVDHTPGARDQRHRVKPGMRRMVSAEQTQCRDRSAWMSGSQGPDGGTRRSCRSHGRRDSLGILRTAQPHAVPARHRHGKASESCACQSPFPQPKGILQAGPGGCKVPQPGIGWAAGDSVQSPLSTWEGVFLLSGCILFKID